MDVVVDNVFRLDTRMILVGVMTFLVVYLATYKRDRVHKNLPPTPRVLPLIGTPELFGTPTVEKLNRAARLGDKNAVRVYAGPIRAFILNSYEAIREAAIDKAAVFSERGHELSFGCRQTNPNLKGIINSNFHERLRTNRSLSLTIFRNLGVGRSTMEERIHEEVQSLVASFSQQTGTPFNPWHVINCAVLNVILYITFNKRHEHTDRELHELVSQTDRFIKSGSLQPVIDGVPWLRYFGPFRKSHNDLLQSDAHMRDFMWNYAKQQIAGYDGVSDSNFIDCWLQKHYDKSEGKPIFDKEDLLYILRDFLIAGSETTTTSLRWLLVFAANRQDMQQKAYEEIVRVVGHQRPVTLSDRKHLPYVEAIILEIQRYNTIVPRAIPHYTKHDTTIADYTILADSIVIFNLHAVHRNPDVFQDPDEFRPERFIDADGKFSKHPHVIPFGIGKRSCLGEILAVQELFLFTAGLLQNFKFLPPEGQDRISEDGVFGFTYGPDPFKIRAVPRI